MHEVAGTYSPVTGTCIFLHTHRGLVNAIGILVADAVLLLAMLIGLLRTSHRNATGIWKLLYQQVMLRMFSLYFRMFSLVQCITWFVLALIAEIPIVVCAFPSWDDIQLIIPGRRSPEFEWCVSLPTSLFFSKPVCGQRLIAPFVT